MLFEDNADLRNAIGMLITGTKGFTLVGAYADVLAAEHWINNHNPDVVLMDINLPGRSGIQALKSIRQNNKDLRIVMLTVFEDDNHIINAICEGASGYLLKNTSPIKLLASIEEVLQGGAPLTPSIASKVLKLFALPMVKSSSITLTAREKEILKLLVSGNSYKMIGAQLLISIETVKTHIKKIYEKMQVHSQTEAVAKAINERLV